MPTAAKVRLLAEDQVIGELTVRSPVELILAVELELIVMPERLLTPPAILTAPDPALIVSAFFANEMITTPEPPVPP